MPRFRSCTLLVCLLAASLPSARAQSENWLPITPQDLQVNEVPGEPGAPAILLYYAHYIDDTLHSQFVYRRIKVLNEKGNKYADVEIPLTIPGSSITNLKARTVHPDGTIIEFTGTSFEKVINKSQSLKYLAKTFTMPEVTAGSIIEYRYLVLMPERQFYNHSWMVQHDLYTVKENFSIKPYKGRLETKHGVESGLSMIYSNLPANVQPQRTAGGWTMEAHDVPAFHAEPSMPPVENFQPHVRFYYGGSEVSSVDKYWQQVGRDWNDEAERFIGKHPEIQKTAQEAIGQETDWNQQARKLYARAQQIRNLTYERPRKKEELEKEDLKPNTNVVDVLNHGYGTRKDIVYFFVALARSAGFNASVLHVSDRSEYFFNKGLLSTNQFNSEMAVVKINGQDVYLSPGTKFCPYGLVRWMHTWTIALKPDKEGGTFISIPAASNEKAVLQRDGSLVLAEDGSLSGEVTVKFQGGEALEHRLDFRYADDAGKKKDLEREVKNWLGPNAVVTLTKMDGWEGDEEPLVAQFHLQVPDYASVTGKRILAPPVLFQRKQREVFSHPERKYPLYFRYAFSEKDSVHIKLPAGYSLEGSPPDQQTKLSYAAYQSLSKVESGELVTQRVLLLNGFYFDVSHYSEIRDFFGKVQAGDEQQAVLRPGGANSAKNTN